MTHRETLDEAIDRVATRMTQSGDAAGGEVPRIWLTTSPRAGRLAMGIAGAAAVVLALVVLRMLQVDEQRSVRPVASALVAWSPLAPVVEGRNPTSSSDRSGRPSAFARSASADRRSFSGGWSGRPIRAVLKGSPYNASTDSSSETGTRPAWGIPFIEAPAALVVSAPSLTALDVDAVAVEAIEIAPLTVNALDGAQD